MKPGAKPPTKGRPATPRGQPSGKLALAVLVLLFLTVSAWLWVNFRSQSPHSGPSAKSFPQVSQAEIDQLAALEAKEQAVNNTVWAKEILAQRCGKVFDQAWDAVNASTNKWQVLADFSADEIIPAVYGTPQLLPHGMVAREPHGSAAAWTPADWRRFLSDCQRDGWEPLQWELRHNRFETDAAGQPKQSVFYFSAHLTKASPAARAVVEGDLIVDWTAGGGSEAPPAIKRIDASKLILRTRAGEPEFRELLVERIDPPAKSFFIDPLILYDLDGDGLSEIILAAKNLVYHRRAGERFESSALCRDSPGLIFTGLIADFDGDGWADFLCAKFEGLLLYRGSPQGRFDQPARPVWTIHPHLKYGQVLTGGDMDGDGDLDVFLGQYKAPYVRGQMPVSYYDANDGHPSYLLMNDGRGNFTEATQAAGLGAKRLRRCYSASFADLDDDGDLDLVVVSDFAGIDLYLNDGRGHFADVTRDWVSEPSAFGMSHALADFDGDGHRDLLMIGMNSPTVERLNHLGLRRPERPDYPAMQTRMTYGNRLYLARPGKKFQTTPLNGFIARSGWSWGCAASDFDNDGFLDVYIANGHESKQSVVEYEPEFWLHDIYVGHSKDDLVTSAYFGLKSSRTRGRGQSYGGYEKNRLYLNRGGESFVEAGHLMGVALEPDSRNVAADDLDGDGRLDLLVTTFEVWPQVQQTLRVFKNTFEGGEHWIGFRLREQGNGISPVGARIVLHHTGGAMTRQIVTGDSFRTQHANTAHFGLGGRDRVEAVEIRWMNGRTNWLHQPAVNRYHAVTLSESNRGQRLAW